MMIDRWTERNIDLSLLSQEINGFFTERLFETELKPTERGFRIQALTRKILNQQLKIAVDIYGQPTDFTVEFVTDPKRKGTLSPSMVLGYVASAFGAGSFLLSELKLREALDKLENMFWQHVDVQVDKLTNSATARP